MTKATVLRWNYGIKAMATQDAHYFTWINELAGLGIVADSWNFMTANKLEALVKWKPVNCLLTLKLIVIVCLPSGYKRSSIERFYPPLRCESLFRKFPNERRRRESSPEH